MDRRGVAGDVQLHVRVLSSFVKQKLAVGNCAGSVFVAHIVLDLCSVRREFLVLSPARRLVGTMKESGFFAIPEHRWTSFLRKYYRNLMEPGRSFYKFFHMQFWGQRRRHGTSQASPTVQLHRDTSDAPPYTALEER